MPDDANLPKAAEPFAFLATYLPKAPQARCGRTILDPSDNSEGVTVTQEAWGGVTIIDADGACIEINDVTAAVDIANAILKAAL